MFGYRERECKDCRQGRDQDTVHGSLAGCKLAASSPSPCYTNHLLWLTEVDRPVAEAVKIVRPRSLARPSAQLLSCAAGLVSLLQAGERKSILSRDN